MSFTQQSNIMDDGNVMDAATLESLAQTERELNTISIDDYKKASDRQERQRRVAEWARDQYSKSNHRWKIQNECEILSASFDRSIHDCLCARCHVPTSCDIAEGSWPYVYFTDVINTHCHKCVQKITHNPSTTYPCNQCEMRLPTSRDPTRKKMCETCETLFGNVE